MDKAWGENRYTWGDTPTTFQYTGQRNDAIIGLYFYNARYYDASLGRFVQADTIIPNPANPQSLNRYAYVYNNPLRYIDPSGHGICDGPGGEANPDCQDYQNGSGANPLSNPQQGLSSGALDTIGVVTDVGLVVAEDLEAMMWVARGLRISRSGTNPAFWIIRGAAQARRQAGFLSNVTRMTGTNARLALFNTNPLGLWGGMVDAMASRWTAASLVGVVGIDVYDYWRGPHSEEGLASAEFAAAVTVDGGINLVSTALGGGVTGLVAGPPGIISGIVVAVVANVALNATVRDSLYESMTDIYRGAGDFLSGAGYVVTHGFPLIVEPAPGWCGAPDCNW